MQMKMKVVGGLESDFDLFLISYKIDLTVD